MSKRSNKRAKKLDQDTLLESLVSLDQRTQLSQLKDDDLFSIRDSKSSQLSSNQLRKKELTDLLFNTAPKTTNIAPGTKFPKMKVVGAMVSSNRTKSNHRFRNLIEADEAAFKNDIDELRALKFVNKGDYKVVGYTGDDNNGDVNFDMTDFVYMRPPLVTEKLQLAQRHANVLIANASEDDEKEIEVEEVKPKNTKKSAKSLVLSKKTAPQSSEDEEDDDEESECSDPEFMADWIKYTGNITKPIKNLRHHHKLRFQALKDHHKFLEREHERDTTFKSDVKATPGALAKSMLTRNHVDYLDFDLKEDTEDLWDADVIQAQSETKLGQNKQNRGRQAHDFDLEDNMDYLIPLTRHAMKNKRDLKTSKHVTTKSFRVAPAGLSINPVKEDMDALVTTYQRKLKNSRTNIARLRRALDSDSIKVKYAHDVGAKLKARMAKTIYKPIPDGHDVHKQKTKQERNAEKKKAENRYLHMLELREKRFNAQFKRLFKDIEAMKKHEKFVVEKLPVLRAEAAEVKKDQPLKFGRNHFKPLKPDLQTAKTLEESGGHLRRSFMSTSLLADQFSSLQRTNKIPAVGKSGKRPKATKMIWKDAMASGVKVGKINVDEIMKKAKERAIANPKPVAPTKNKKRKFQELQDAHGRDAVHYDYGYDSDDDIWA